MAASPFLRSSEVHPFVTNEDSAFEKGHSKYFEGYIIFCQLTLTRHAVINKELATEKLLLSCEENFVCKGRA